MISNHCHKDLFLILPVFFFILCLTFPVLHHFPTEIDPSAETHNFPKDPCSGRRIYIHDLPSKFNQDLLTNCTTLIKFFNFCPYLQNNGFGLPLNESDSDSALFSSLSDPGNWYATNQFTLSVIFHSRMKDYECLTNDSSQADAIYAPFYPGLEVGRHLWGEFSDNVRDAMAQDFVTWLREQPEWRTLLGWDHFFVSGRITWDLQRLTVPGSHWGNNLLNLPETHNMTVIIVEKSPDGENEFGVPYPTYFHPSSDSDVVHWQDRVRGAKRRYLFTFSGAPRANTNGSIRGELMTQCSNSEKCKLITCVSGDFCVSPVNIIRTFLMSDFCLQPTGDSYTRRSTFDSILSGCIPVFFHPRSAYTQYLWHFPKNHTKYSVFIPMESVRNGSVNVEEVLSRVPEEDIFAMREEVVRLIPKVIYAQKKLEKFEDAFDIIIKNVLQRIAGARRLIRKGKDPRRIT